METTLVLLKPDATERRLVGAILLQFELAGFTITRIRSVMHPSIELCQEHYREHEGKPFYQRTVDFLHSGLVVAVLLTGENAVQSVRDFVGATDPAKAADWTIRGGHLTWVNHKRERLPCNLVHASDSLDAVEREMGIWFA